MTSSAQVHDVILIVYLVGVASAPHDVVSVQTLVLIWTTAVPALIGHIYLK